MLLFSAGVCNSTNIHADHCYEVVQELKTFAQAQTVCAERAHAHGYHSAQLAAPSDAGTNRFVNDVMLRTRNAARDPYYFRELLLGGLEKAGTPVWKWTSGEPQLSLLTHSTLTPVTKLTHSTYSTLTPLTPLTPHSLHSYLIQFTPSQYMFSPHSPHTHSSFTPPLCMLSPHILCAHSTQSTLTLYLLQTHSTHLMLILFSPTLIPHSPDTTFPLI